MLRIFDHHVLDGFAAYPETPLSEEEIRSLLHQTTGYPAVAAEDPDGSLVGFGFLRPYSPVSTFAQTGMISYFVESSRTRRGIGTAILRHLTEEAHSQGIARILAHISSKNPQSFAFHQKHGFVECGRFPEIGRKFGEPFNVVWVVKDLVQDT